MLEQQQCDIQVIEYLKTPLSAAELTKLLQQLGLSARALLRNKEAEFKQLGLDNPALTEQQLIDAMVAQPKLIERPVIINGDKAVIGRPASNILPLLS